MVEIYTDGASKGNPGAGGWGFVVVKNSEVFKEFGGGAKVATNNEMELVAFVKALYYALKEFAGEKVIIFTDSMYVNKGFNEWLEGWKRNGWRTAGKKPVKNVKFWKKIDEIVSGCDVSNIEVRHVRGHSGHKFNEMADFIASSMAEKMAGK